MSLACFWLEIVAIGLPSGPLAGHAYLSPGFCLCWTNVPRVPRDQHTLAVQADSGGLDCTNLIDEVGLV